MRLSMRPGRSLSVLGCVVVLGLAAPSALAAPTAQGPAPGAGWGMPFPMMTSALQSAMRQAVEQIVPSEIFQQARPQFIPVDGNRYVVSHPGLYWRVEAAPAADAMAEVLSRAAPGWGTAVYDGPQGHGVYLTYQPSQ